MSGYLELEGKRALVTGGTKGPDSLEPSSDVLRDAIVAVVNTPFGKRPFRVHIDPAEAAPMSASRSSIAFAARCCIAWDCPTS
jgi:hypothetical protein